MISGSNLVRSTRIMFDGLPAKVIGQSEINGDLTVIPPPGSAGHRAVVSALDLDGQSSSFLDSASPRTYTYDAAEPPSVMVSPSALPAGTEAMVEITGVNTAFADGQTIAGFGTSDVVVRRVWAVGPSRLLANVRTSAGAQTGSLPLTVLTGLQIANQVSALQIQPAQPGVPVVNPEILDAATGQPSIYAGGRATVEVAALPAGLTAAGIVVTLDGLPAEVVGLQEDRITFMVPGSLGTGPAILRLTTGGQQCQPVVVGIDPAPPVIKSVSNRSGLAVSPDAPAFIGSDLFVTVAGLAEPEVLDDPSRVKITLGGIPHAARSITIVEGDPGVHILRFTVGKSVEPAGAVLLTVAVGYRVSEPVAIPVENAR